MAFINFFTTQNTTAIILGLQGLFFISIAFKELRKKFTEEEENGC